MPISEGGAPAPLPNGSIGNTAKSQRQLTLAKKLRNFAAAENPAYSDLRQRMDVRRPVRFPRRARVRRPLATTACHHPPYPVSAGRPILLHFAEHNMVTFAMRGPISNAALLVVALLAVAPSVAIAGSCAAGSFSHNGQTPCTLCAPGSFQPDAGQTSCRAAQAGWSASGTGPGGSGAKAQTICKEGTFTTKEGSAACTACPAGSYCNGEGCTQPTLCPPGYFSDTPGAGQMCKACPKGTFQANHGATSCCLCCSGFYNDQTSQPHCFQCPVRGASSPAGATASKQCSSKPNGGLPSCTESSYGTCPKTGGSPTHAPAARRRNVKRDVCPSGMKSCPLYGSTSGRGFLKGYECVDVRRDLESCGGCAHNDSPFGQPAPDGGRDCSAIPFVHDVKCASGACVVEKCRDGYEPTADKGSCVAKSEDGKPTAVWRVQL